MTDEESLRDIAEAHEDGRCLYCVPGKRMCATAFLLDQVRTAGRLLDEARRERDELQVAYGDLLDRTHSNTTKLLPMSGGAWRTIRKAALGYAMASDSDEDHISETRFREILVEALRPVTEEPDCHHCAVCKWPTNHDVCPECGGEIHHGTQPVTGEPTDLLFAVRETEFGTDPSTVPADEVWSRVNAAREELAAGEEEDEKGAPFDA